MSNYTTENLIPVQPGDVPAGTPAVRIGNLVFPMQAAGGSGSGSGGSGSGSSAEELIPANGLIISALPDPTWVSGNSVSAWGDFVTADSMSTAPQLAAIGGVVGIKARQGDKLTGTASAFISGDFTYLAKICIGTPVDIGEDMTLLSNNQTGSAIIAFGDAYSSDCLLLSVQGVSAAWSDIAMSGLSAGTHTLAVTYNATSGEVKFYVDGSLAYTDSESYSGGTYFDQSATFYYSQSTTSDNLILGLAAYNRILTDAEIAAVNW